MNAGLLRAGLRWLCVLGLAIVSCSSAPRAPATTCMQRTVDSLGLETMAGDRKHCVASGTIALRCGTVAAWTAGYGKEFADLFGPGSFQRRDLRANRAGRGCASRTESEDGLASCCAEAGF